MVDYVPPESFKDESLNTIGGAIADGTKYGDYITGNKFTNATDKFIAKNPQQLSIDTVLSLTIMFSLAGMMLIVLFILLTIKYQPINKLLH